MQNHVPVLLSEVIDYLSIKPGGKYIDATLGLGGHAVEIVRRGGWVLGIEMDPESLEEAKRYLSADLTPARRSLGEGGSGHLTFNKLRLVRGNFKDIKGIAEREGFVPCDGVLFDLGMSSWQLERSSRGFSFQKEEPLDMRMDPDLGVTAADLLNSLSKNELKNLFQKFGEEQSAQRIAAALVRARSVKPLRTTGDLVDVVLRVNKRRRGRLPARHRYVQALRARHPATKVFQALRIAVNDEIENLRSALPQAFEILKPGGRLAVISFHSLEDREVKNFSRFAQGQKIGEVLTPKPIHPSKKELTENPRCRSARLRVVKHA